MGCGRCFHLCPPRLYYTVGTWCVLFHSCQHRPRIETNSSTLSKSAVYKVRTSAISATAYHKGSTPRLDPRPHTLLKWHQQHISQAVGSSLIHLYADDKISYSAEPTLDFVLKALKQNFIRVQQAFSALNIVLNTSKTKLMWFGKKNDPLPTGVITTSEGLELEVVTWYKYG
jgi:hypothetical protein